MLYYNLRHEHLGNKLRVDFGRFKNGTVSYWGPGEPQGSEWSNILGLSVTVTPDTVIVKVYDWSTEQAITVNRRPRGHQMLNVSGGIVVNNLWPVVGHVAHVGKVVNEDLYYWV